MDRKYEPIALPYRITEFNEDMLLALDRNFSEIARLLSQLQVYENLTGVPTNVGFMANLKRFPNKVINSSFEWVNEITREPMYWEGGAKVTEAEAWAGTYSIELKPGENTEQGWIDETIHAGANPGQWGNRQTRVSFKQKGNILRVWVKRVSDNSPYPLIDNSGETHVSGDYLDYGVSTDWPDGYRTFYFIPVEDAGQVKICFQNVGFFGSTYVDAVQMEPDFTGMHPSFYTDGPRSLSPLAFLAFPGSAVVYHAAQNTGALTIATSNITICSREFVLATKADILVHFSMRMSAAAALTATVEVLLNDGIVGITGQQICTAAGMWMISFAFPLAAQTAGTKRFLVRARTSASSFTVAANQAFLTAQTRGSGIGEMFDPNPKFTKELFVFVPAEPVHESLMTPGEALVIELLLVVPDAPELTYEALMTPGEELSTVFLLDDVPVPVVSLQGFNIFAQFILGDDDAMNIFDVNWEAQTFTPIASHQINYVELWMLRTGAPGDVTVSIRETSEGLPTGADLVSATINGNDLSTGTMVVSVNLTGAALTGGVVYAIVVRATGGDSTNHVSWRADATSPPYTGGQRCLSTNSGSSWTADSTRDFLFSEGIIVPNG